MFSQIYEPSEVGNIVSKCDFVVRRAIQNERYLLTTVITLYAVLGVAVEQNKYSDCQKFVSDTPYIKHNKKFIKTIQSIVVIFCDLNTFSLYIYPSTASLKNVK